MFQSEKGLMTPSFLTDNTFLNRKSQLEGIFGGWQERKMEVG
jgi:hypothetical protein